MTKQKSMYKKLKFNKELLFNRTSVPSLISETLEIEGTLKSKGTIEIEGKIKGDIKADIVTLRETSFTEGTIKANIVNIKGRFEGKVFANKLNISKEARVFGEVNYFSLSVEDGALIEGQLKRSKEEIVKSKKAKEVSQKILKEKK